MNSRATPAPEPDPVANPDAPLWVPSPARVASSLLTPFALAFSPDVAIGDYAALWRRSVTRREDFWAAVWKDTGVIGEPGDSVLGKDGLPGAEWFPRARLNFAENLLKPFPTEEALGRPALVTWSESGPGRSLSRAELRAEVLRVASGLVARRRAGRRPRGGFRRQRGRSRHRHAGRRADRRGVGLVQPGFRRRRRTRTASGRSRPGCCSSRRVMGMREKTSTPRHAWLR